MEPLVKNAADENELKEAKQRQKLARLNEKNDWLEVMSTDAGFRLLAELMRFCKIEESPMAPTDADRCFRIGRQNVGKYIKAQMILADRRKYFEMELKTGEQS